MSANKDNGPGNKDKPTAKGVESLTLTLQQIAASTNQNTEQFESQKKLKDLFVYHYQIIICDRIARIEHNKKYTINTYTNKTMDNMSLYTDNFSSNSHNYLVV